MSPITRLRATSPKYGNDDDRADDIAVELLRSFLEKIKRRHTYRNSEATTSILTITSNVVYGKATGAMPDGRKAYTPFAPGGNPSYGAETTVCWRPSTPLLSCPTTGRWTASPTPRPSTPMRWATARASA